MVFQFFFVPSPIAAIFTPAILRISTEHLSISSKNTRTPVGLVKAIHWYSCSLWKAVMQPFVLFRRRGCDCRKFQHLRPCTLSFSAIFDIRSRGLVTSIFLPASGSFSYHAKRSESSHHLPDDDNSGRLDALTLLLLPPAWKRSQQSFSSGRRPFLKKIAAGTTHPSLIPPDFCRYPAAQSLPSGIQAYPVSPTSALKLILYSSLLSYGR